MTAGVALRAALYRRVSKARQAEHDVSIPDQRRQGEAYCAARGYELGPDCRATEWAIPHRQHRVDG